MVLSIASSETHEVSGNGEIVATALHYRLKGDTFPGLQYITESL